MTETLKNIAVVVSGAVCGTLAYMGLNKGIQKFWEKVEWKAEEAVQAHSYRQHRDLGKNLELMVDGKIKGHFREYHTDNTFAVPRMTQIAIVTQTAKAVAKEEAIKAVAEAMKERKEAESNA